VIGAMTLSDVAPSRKAYCDNVGAYVGKDEAVLLTRQENKWPSQRYFELVELRRLEPLTFPLRRHGVDLIRREHGVIDVQVRLETA
jgi:hypothetical protein